MQPISTENGPAKAAGEHNDLELDFSGASLYRAFAFLANAAGGAMMRCSIRTIAKATLMSLALVSAGAASAVTLTFDELYGAFGRGYFFCNPSMTCDSDAFAYRESGFVMTLHTSNAPGLEIGAHIGDGSYFPETFNWHDGADNGASHVTLTKQDGGLFNLHSFFFQTEYQILLTVTSTNFLALYTGSTTEYPSLQGVSSVTFFTPTFVTLDDINVTAGNGSDGLPSGPVPEPGSWAMMITGFAAIGMSARRRQRAKVRLA